MKHTVSIVVPCYNVEKFLAKCLDSLLSQTFQDFEVVMVEDCSTDGTKQIIMEYEKKHKNFRAIYNKKNGGLGNARNVGIATVKSEFIAFLDSDDWWPENFLEEMLGTIKKNKADIAVCDIYLRFDDKKKDHRIVAYHPKPDKFGLINTGTSASSSNKLFRRSLFDSIKYPVDIVNEDIPVTLCLLASCKIAYTDKTHFSYYQRAGSIQNSKITKKRFDVFRSLELLRDNLGGKVDKKMWQAVVWHQIIAVFLYVVPRARGLINRRGLIKEFNRLVQEHNIEVKNNFGLKEFSNSSIVNKIYGSTVIWLLDKRLYSLTSLLMGLYYFYAYNRHIRLFVLAIRKPRTTAKRIIRALKPKRRVIKKNINMQDLIKEAKRQHSLSSDMKISVAIPNYNYERFLFQRVYSILSQTEKITELIILDDVSSDGSVELAKRIKKEINDYVTVRLINNKKNKGTFAQWKRGFKEAKGDYVWIAEADDYSSRNFLKLASKPYRENKDLVISYVDTGYVNKKGFFLGSVKRDIDYQKSGHWNQDYINKGYKEAREYSYLNNTIANVSSVLFKKLKSADYDSMFKEATKFRQAGDWVFYVNYMMLGDIAYTNKTANFYRMHGDNVSATTKANDHLDEIKRIYGQFHKKLSLGSRHQKKMNARMKLLAKSWGVTKK